jgi:hypothetical protein
MVPGTSARRRHAFRWAAAAVRRNTVMTAAREELRRLVEELPKDQVPVALVEMQRLVGASTRRCGLRSGSEQ